MVTLTGAHFTRATAVVFGGAPSAVFTVVSDARIVAQVPVGAATGPVVVTTSGGAGASTVSFIVVPPPPVIAALLPASGAPGSVVTVAGSGFAGAVLVTFGGVPASFTVTSGAAITATVPVAAVSGPVTVTTPGGAASSQASFTVIPRVTAGLTLGVRPASLRLGATVKASGMVTPASLAGASVKLTVQRRRGGAWASVKTVAVTANPGGPFAWTYKPGRKGSYRLRAALAAAPANTAALTSWRAFTVR
jgi:hypothetical protein